MDHMQKNDIPIHLGQVLKCQKILFRNIFYHFLFAVSLGNRAAKMSFKFRLDLIIGFQNTFYTKCINVIIDSNGPSIILRSIINNHSNTAIELYDEVTVFKIFTWRSIFSV